MTPVRYSPDVESPEEDEAATIAHINQSLAELEVEMFDRYRHAVRSVHAKSHGCLTGVLEVGPLPTELAQGLFAQPGRYDAAVRISSSPSDIEPDSVSTPRGFAIKVLGVDGARIEGSEDASTQDFLLVSQAKAGPADIKTFSRGLDLLNRHSADPDWLKKTVSAVARIGGQTAEAVRLDPVSAGLKGLGYPFLHPLGDAYFSQVPIRFGDYIAKIGLYPANDATRALEGVKLDLNGDHSGLRDAVVRFFNENEAVYELRAQLCTDLDAMPVEDASVIWDEAVSPYRTVATLTLPRQQAYETGQRLWIDDRLTFNAWHGLEAHRPLGRIMRARRVCYARSVAYRGQMNGCPMHEPRALAG